MNLGSMDKYIELNDHSLDIQSLSLNKDVRVRELKLKSSNK